MTHFFVTAALSGCHYLREVGNRMRRSVLAAGLALLVGSVPGSVSAQTTIAGRAASLTVGGRLHLQYQTSSVDEAINSFFIRRARVIMDGEFNDFFVGRLQTDFVGGRATVLDAYVRMDFSEAFRLTVGQRKRPFDIFELASSTDLSIIERGGAIVGYSECAGVGRLCTLGRFGAALRYSGRDAGVFADGRAGRFTYAASLSNGNGIIDITDENDGKSVGARGGFDVTEGITVAAHVAVHDYLGADDETAHAVGWGFDVESGTWRDGLLLQAGVMGGDNWRLLDETSGDPATFVAAQAVVSYYFPLEGDRIAGLEPLARVSVGDPSRDTDDDGGVLLTPGFMLYLLGKNKIGVNLDYYMPGTGDDVFSFRVGTFLYF